MPALTMRLAVLGTFGAGNLGDESVFLAFQQGFRRAYPQGKLSTISPDPEYFRRVHNAPGLPLRRKGPPAPDQVRRRSLLEKAARRLAKVPGALRRTRSFLGEMRAFARGQDALVILGGGQIFDYWEGPFGHPWNLYAWARVFHQAGKPILVPSIGACPLLHRLSAYFVRTTLASASYVGFRDLDTENIARGFGYGGKATLVPDLAFSLRYDPAPMADRRGWIALSPMVYAHPDLWPRGSAAQYEGMLDKLADFGRDLLDRDYRLRLFVSQIRTDRHALADLLARLDGNGELRREGRIQIPEVRDVPTLLKALESVEAVVAERFHMVVLSLLLQKPVISLGYQPKNDRVLDDFGLRELALDIQAFRREDLEKAFAAARERIADPEGFRTAIGGKLEEFRRRLDAQFAEIFAMVPAEKEAA
jgi:polysaccharide pyruvyl transferase WcaK-like protein